MAILTPLFNVFEQILPKIVNFGRHERPYYLLRGGILGSSLDGAGSNGDYWSSTPNDSSYAYYLYFYLGNISVGYFYRYYGHSVRCVAAG